MLNYVTSASPAELARMNQYSSQTTTAANYDYAPDWMFGNSAMGDVGDGVQINGGVTYNETSAPATEGNLVSGCSDGKDDGKISLGSKIVNTLWGAGKAVVNTVKDIVTDPKKAIVAVATTAVCIAFPPAAVVVGAVGVATGVMGCVNAWNNASNATTDDEAKAAFQDFGASGLQVGLSAVAVKGGLNAMKATQGSAMSNITKSTKGGLRGAVENAGKTVRAFAEDTVTGGRGFQQGTLKINTANAGYKGTQLWGTVKGNLSNSVENIKTNGIHPIQSARTAAGNARQTITNGFHSAGETLSEAGQNLKTNGIHPIQTLRTGAGRFSEAATTAGYSSAFGSLAAPVANEVKNSNEAHSNYNEAVYRNMVLGANATEYGGYDFSNDWMTLTPNFSGNYTYNSYEDFAQYAGYNARQIVGM